MSGLTSLFVSLNGGIHIGMTARGIIIIKRSLESGRAEKVSSRYQRILDNGS